MQSKFSKSFKTEHTYSHNSGVTPKNKKRKRLLLYDDGDADDDGGVGKPKAISMCKRRLLLEGYAEGEIKQTNHCRNTLRKFKIRSSPLKAWILAAEKLYSLSEEQLNELC